MRFLPVILFAVLIYFVIGNVSIQGWDIGIYILFICFLGYRLFINLKHLYKIRRNQVCDGLIISFTKKKPEDVEDSKCNVEVKFYSPLNNEEYIIKADIEKLPENGLVDVVFDKDYPRHSKVYLKFNLWENIFLGLPFIFFIYQLFSKIFALTHFLF
jgi:hypothetical protein